MSPPCLWCIPMHSLIMRNRSGSSCLGCRICRTSAVQDKDEAPMRKAPTVRAPINVFMIAPHESIKAGITSFPAGHWVTAHTWDSRAPIRNDRTSSKSRRSGDFANRRLIDPAPDFRRIGFVHLPVSPSMELWKFSPRTAWKAMKAPGAMHRFSPPCSRAERAGRIARTAKLYSGFVAEITFKGCGDHDRPPLPPSPPPA